MHATSRHSNAFLIATILVGTLIVPFMAFAQATDLERSIRTEIMKDPRSAQIPQADMDAMVAVLAQSASQQGVTASDISWRPVEAAASETAPVACDFLCMINAIFGFGGNNYTIPIGLGITSALLILFISMMLHRHHVHGVEPTIEAVHRLPETPAKQ